MKLRKRKQTMQEGRAVGRAVSLRNSWYAQADASGRLTEGAQQAAEAILAHKGHNLREKLSEAEWAEYAELHLRFSCIVSPGFILYLIQRATESDTDRAIRRGCDLLSRNL